MTSVNLFYEGLILWLEVEMLKKIRDVWSWYVNSGPWLRINFMILSWNFVISCPVNNWPWPCINFKIYVTSVNLFYEGLILWLKVEMLKKIRDVWSWFVNSEPWPRIYFVVLSWNMIINCPVYNWHWPWIYFKISNWRAEEN